jgi:hypothetical protein
MVSCGLVENTNAKTPFSKSISQKQRIDEAFDCKGPSIHKFSRRVKKLKSWRVIALDGLVMK